MKKEIILKLIMLFAVLLLVTGSVCIAAAQLGGVDEDHLDKDHLDKDQLDNKD
jgi:hypothetical protein